MARAPRRGIVLVHGAQHTSRCWDALIPHLELPAVSFDLPGRNGVGPDLPSFEDHMNIVLAAMASSRLEHVVLVGHSMAGFFLPEVAARRPDLVKHLVLVSCVVPPRGGTIFDTMPRWQAAALRLQLRLSPTLCLPGLLARPMFCSDIDRDGAKGVLATFVPEPLRQLAKHRFHSTLPPDLPRTYVKLLDDRALPPTMQERNIRNLGGAEIVALRAGHDVMVSRPALLAEVLNRIARPG